MNPGVLNGSSDFAYHCAKVARYVGRYYLAVIGVPRGHCGKHAFGRVFQVGVVVFGRRAFGVDYVGFRFLVYFGTVVGR